MRKKPWEFIEKMIFGVRDAVDADAPRMLVVTGMGGCGKTQLILKFVQVYKNKSVVTPGAFDFLCSSKVFSNTVRRW
jgi:GTPase SAR1 family protein